MITIIKAFLSLILIAFMLVVLICVLWFLLLIVVNFWKTNCKPKPKPKCYHGNMTYHDGLYGFWKCNDCSETFPD